MLLLFFMCKLYFCVHVCVCVCASVCALARMYVFVCPLTLNLKLIPIFYSFPQLQLSHLCTENDVDSCVQSQEKGTSELFHCDYQHACDGYMD